MLMNDLDAEIGENPRSWSSMAALVAPRATGFSFDRIIAALATGVMRHPNAGYGIAVECAEEHGLKLPMLAA